MNTIMDNYEDKKNRKEIVEEKVKKQPIKEQWDMETSDIVEVDSDDDAFDFIGQEVSRENPPPTIDQINKAKSPEEIYMLGKDCG